MISINGDMYEFEGKTIKINGSEIAPAMASFGITSLPCEGNGMGIFSPTEVATFLINGLPRKVAFGDKLNYATMPEEEISRMIERRAYSIAKVAEQEISAKVDYHGIPINIHRQTVQVGDPLMSTKELTGVDWCDGFGIFTSDGIVTMEVAGEEKDFDFSVIGLAIYENAEGVADALDERLAEVREWVQSVKAPAPGPSLEQILDDIPMIILAFGGL